MVEDGNHVLKLLQELTAASAAVYHHVCVMPNRIPRNLLTRMCRALAAAQERLLETDE